MYLVGIDWADCKHDVYIQDEQGQKQAYFTIESDAQGLDQLLERLTELAAPAELAIALETNQGLLVESLLAAGYTVYPLNPKITSRFRDRFRSSRTKSDYFDARVLADVLRTDRERFEPLRPSSEAARELALLGQDYRHLIETQTKLSNQLTACLKRYYPQVLKLFSKLNQPVTLQFILAYPTPQAARSASQQELTRFLRQQAYPGAKAKAQDIKTQLAKLRYRVDPATTRAKTRLAQVLAQQLLSLRPAVAAYRAEFERFLALLPEGEVFQSLPGAGPVLAARLLGELGDNRQVYASAQQVQCQAGTAPVTRQSGRHRYVVMRRACRRSFRHVIHQFAFSSLSKSAWAQEYYQQQRDRGHSYGQALRALGNKWLKIIYAMWQNQTLYDEDYHQRQRKAHAPKAA